MIKPVRAASPRVKSRVSADEWRLWVDLAACYRRVARTDPGYWD
jgi:hypothetical protein